MSLVYAQDFEAYAVGTDVDPNVPNWKWSPQTGSSNSCKINTGFTGKYARLLPFGGEWANLCYDVVLAQTYKEFRGRSGNSTGFQEFFVNQQSVNVFPAGYVAQVTASAWAIGYDTGGGFTSLVSGSQSCNIGDFKFRVIMNGTVMSLWIDDVAIPGASYDFSLIGNPYPSGRFGLTVISNDAALDDFQFFDAPVSGALPDKTYNRRRRL